LKVSSIGAQSALFFYKFPGSKETLNLANIFDSWFSNNIS